MKMSYVLQKYFEVKNVICSSFRNSRLAIGLFVATSMIGFQDASARLIQTVPMAVYSAEAIEGHYDGFKTTVKLKLSVASLNFEGHAPYIIVENTWHGDLESKTIDGAISAGMDVMVSQKPVAGPSALTGDQIYYTWTTLGVREGHAKTQTIRFFQKNVQGKIQYLVLKEVLDSTGKINVKDQKGHILISF